MKSEIGISGTLDRESILGLLDERIGAIHVPGFYPADLAARFAAAIASHSELGNYKVQNALRRLGMGYVDVGYDSENARRYHAEALHSIRVIRDLLYPTITPIDHFRLLLEEIWPAGATIEGINGKKCFVGTCRVVDPGSQMLPHSDRFARLLPVDSLHLKGQLAMNVYLQMPRKGGDVELWLRPPTPEEDREHVASDGLDRAALEEPRLVIRPGVGDLLLFNSELIHSVSPGVDGQRVTTSCFVGYRADDSPLTYWS